MTTTNNFHVKLIHCGNRDINTPGENREKHVFYMPMGIFSLAGILDRDNFDVRIHHLDLEESSRIEDILDFSKVDAVGFDCHWANQTPGVIDTVRLIKKIKPGVFIFLGGYTASYFAEEILTYYPEVDAVIRGDAEIPIVRLCRALRSREPRPLFGDVPNLAWRDADNSVVLNRLTFTSSASDMEGFDFDAYHLLEHSEHYRSLSRYWTSFAPFNDEPLYLIEVGRGCIYNCSICGGSAGAQKTLCNREKQVIRSVDSVIASIKKGIKSGYSCFFTCFQFPGSDQWYIDLMEKIKEEQLDISFVYEAWSLPSRQLVDACSEACRQTLFTISPETAVEELRKRNKDQRIFYTNKQLEEECLDHIASKDNVKTQLYFGYYLPFDTVESVYKTMDYITHLFTRYHRVVETFYINFNTDPASLIYCDPKAYQMDVTIQNFRDLELKLRKNFCTDPDKDHSVTLLFRPLQLPEPKAVDLANKINLFTNFFYFPLSLRLLVERTGSVDLFSRRLQGKDLTFAKQAQFTFEAVRDQLIQIAGSLLPHQSDVVDTINKEYLSIPSKSTIKNLTNPFVLDSSMPTADTQKGKEIISGIKKKEKSVDIVFDF